MITRYCEDCDTEFQPHVRVCSDCGGELVDRDPDVEDDVERPPQAPPAGARPPGAYRAIAWGLPPADADSLARQLAAAGVSYQVTARGTFMDLRVRDADAAAAAAVLERSGLVAPGAGADAPAVAQSGGPCPACGDAVAPGDAECASCGLVLGGSVPLCQHCQAECEPQDAVCARCGRPPG